MLKKIVDHVGKRPVIIMDSIARIASNDSGAIVVAASHGGASSGEIALGTPLTAVFLNDAGVGKDKAGIAALAMLENRGVAGGTVSHESACIGDPEDMWECGVISYVNGIAASCGISTGERLRDAVKRIGKIG